MRQTPGGGCPPGEKEFHLETGAMGEGSGSGTMPGWEVSGEWGA